MAKAIGKSVQSCPRKSGTVPVRQYARNLTSQRNTAPLGFGLYKFFLCKNVLGPPEHVNFSDVLGLKLHL